MLRAAALALLVTTATPGPDPTVAGAVLVAAVVDRIAGTDTVLVATGESFHDALAAAGMGHQVRMFTRHRVTQREPERRDPERIVVVGGRSTSRPTTTSRS